MGKALRAAALGCLLLALAVAVAGCGSSSAAPPATTTTSTTTTNGGNQQARSAFTTCLAAHGVTTSGRFGGRRPNGAPPAGQSSRPPLTAKQQQAFQACRSKLPAGFGQGRPGGQTSNPALARYTSCLRQHGVTFGGTNSQAAFRKASAACAKVAPKPATGTSG